MSKARRQHQITRLLEREHILNQHDLAARLARLGVEVQQATLSRDLAELGAVKGPGGYRLLPAAAAEPAPAPRQRLTQALSRLLLEASIGGNLLVLRTPPGQASPLAVEIDRASLPGALGTIAGDDCIFVACDSVPGARALLRQLRSMSAAGPSPTGQLQRN